MTMDTAWLYLQHEFESWDKSFQVAEYFISKVVQKVKAKARVVHVKMGQKYSEYVLILFTTWAWNFM